MTASEFDFCPWLFAGQASDEDRAAQRELSSTGKVRFGDGCFVAASAAVFPDELEPGDRSYLGAHAYVTGEIRLDGYVGLAHRPRRAASDGQRLLPAHPRFVRPVRPPSPVSGTGHRHCPGPQP